MKRTVAATVTAVVATMGLTACGGGDPLSSGSSSTPSATDTISIGSADFAENRLLAEIYAVALTAKGVKVDTSHLNIGSREIYFPALKDGSIDLIPDYTGNLLQFVDKAATQTDSNAVYTALQSRIPSGLTVLDKSSAEDKDAVVVSKATADKYHLKSISDLTAHCADLVLGGPPEWLKRSDGVPGLKKNYDCTFKSYQRLDTGGPLTVAALKNGDIDAGDLFTTDSSITANNFVILADPKNNFAAQNVVPLINAKKAADSVRKTLNNVSAKLNTTTLADLVGKLSGPDKPDAATVAKAWLTLAGLV